MIKRRLQSILVCLQRYPLLIGASYMFPLLVDPSQKDVEKESVV